MTIDVALERLRVHDLPYKRDDHVYTWLAVCPACHTPEWGLTLIDAYRTRLILRCTAGCSEGNIRAALVRDPADIRVEEALGLAEAASAVAARALDLARGLAILHGSQPQLTVGHA
jgi:hypothetical protein